MQEHLRKTMTGDNAFCDDFADDMKVSISAEGGDGPMEMEGGKAELCEYTKQTVAAFRVIRASTHSQFDDVRVVRSGFPWLKAEVTYAQTMTVQANGIPSLTTESQETLVLVRTLSGLKIKSVKSHATGAL